MRSAYFVNLLICWLLDLWKVYSIKNVLFSIFKSMRNWDKKSVFTVAAELFLIVKVKLVLEKVFSKRYIFWWRQ